MDTVMPRAFMNKEYKVLRQNVLFEREMSMMPETQGVAQAELERRKLGNSINEAKKERKLIMEKLKSLDEGVSHMEQEYAKQSSIVLGITEKAQSITFHNTCPVNGCLGYLGSICKRDDKDPNGSHADNCLVCGMCRTRVCKDCLEIIHHSQETHVCQKDIIKSVACIRQECKQCPKCAVLVYRVSGCDQMWCTMCHTAFSWKTGKHDTGPIHNPHWYEWQVAKNENGEDTIADDDIVNINYVVPSLFSIPFTYRYVSWVPCVHRLLMHLVMHTLPRMMLSEYSRNDNRDLRVSFLLREIDEARMKRVLQQREKRREKEVVIREIISSFVCISSDLLRRLGRQSTPDIREVYTYLDNVRVAANDHLARVAHRFSCKVYEINKQWCINDCMMVSPVPKSE